MNSRQRTRPLHIPEQATRIVRQVSDHLLWRGPSGAVEAFVMPSDEFTIGRDANCDIVLTDPSVSAIHATVRRQGAYLLWDASRSSNGVGRWAKKTLRQKANTTIAIGQGAVYWRTASVGISRRRSRLAVLLAINAGLAALLGLQAFTAQRRPQTATPTAAQTAMALAQNEAATVLAPSELTTSSAVSAPPASKALAVTEPNAAGDAIKPRRQNSAAPAAMTAAYDSFAAVREALLAGPVQFKKLSGNCPACSDKLMLALRRLSERANTVDEVIRQAQALQLLQVELSLQTTQLQAWRQTLSDQLLTYLPALLQSGRLKDIKRILDEASAATIEISPDEASAKVLLDAGRELYLKAYALETVNRRSARVGYSQALAILPIQSDLHRQVAARLAALEQGHWRQR